MGQALLEARRERLRRPFLEAGPWIRRLLGTAPLQPLAAGWLTTGDAPRLETPAPLVVQELSERERDVLRRLAQMMSTEEIAADLCVSVNTVKTHLKRVPEDGGEPAQRSGAAGARAAAAVNPRPGDHPRPSRVRRGTSRSDAMGVAGTTHLRPGGEWRRRAAHLPTGRGARDIPNPAMRPMSLVPVRRTGEKALMCRTEPAVPSAADADHRAQADYLVVSTGPCSPRRW